MCLDVALSLGEEAVDYELQLLSVYWFGEQCNFTAVEILHNQIPLPSPIFLIPTFDAHVPLRHAGDQVRCIY